MTILQLGKTVTRQTATTVQGRDLVVTLHAGYLEIRQKGRRQTFDVSYHSIFVMGAKAAADKLREERELVRKAQKRGKKS